MTQNTYQKALIRETASIFDALKIIDAMYQIAIVVSEDNKLLGTVTDGDVRRAILKGIKLTESVSGIMSREPKKILQGAPKSEIRHMMTNLQIRHVPIVDENNHIVGLYSDDDLNIVQNEEEWSVEDVSVVLMLGGEGTRLHPLTKTTPKPMLPIGKKPLLETIVDSFVAQGFTRFYFAVNYMADVIKKHFSDGASRGIQITYLHEDKRLGTAGALSLLPERPKGPLIVMNGDILTNSSFKHMLNFHSHTGVQATMCVREYQQQVPYGIVQTNGTKLTSFVEKPTHSYFVNAGIYVISPTALDFVPDGTYFDMPQLFEVLDKNNYDSAVFPIREYWRDIGRIEDLEDARLEFKDNFGML